MLESPAARFSYAQFTLLTRNALWLTRNPSLGLDYGRDIRFPQMGLLGLALMSSPTLGAAFDVALRHHRGLLPGYELSLRISGEQAVLSIQETINFAPYKRFAIEAIAVVFDTQGRELYGGPLPVRPERIRGRCAGSPNSADGVLYETTGPRPGLPSMWELRGPKVGSAF